MRNSQVSGTQNIGSADKMGRDNLCKCDDCIYIDAMVRRGMWRWKGRQRLGITESFEEALTERVRQAAGKVREEQGSIRGLERSVLRQGIGLCLRHDYDISNGRELEAMENMLVRILTYGGSNWILD